MSASPDVLKDLKDSDALRAEIRSFLDNAPRPAGLRNYGPTPTADDVEPGRTWHRYLADHGYTCLHWPLEFGGAAATVAYQAVFAEECARAGVPRQLNITGADLVGPVLIKFGSQDQKDRYLEADPTRRRRLDAAVLRTRRRVGPRRRAHPSRTHRRRVGESTGRRCGAQRPRRPLRAAAGPHRSGQTPRPVDVRRARWTSRVSRCAR